MFNKKLMKIQHEILQYWLIILKISFTIIQLCNFALSLSHYSKYFCNILDSFEFWKFQTNNVKVMPKDKKVNIAAGNTKGGSITVLLTSCLTGLESAV